MKKALAPIVSSREINPGFFLVWLEEPDIAASAHPGQYVMVQCGPDTVLRRPLSVHRLDRQRGRLAFLFSVVGKGTAWLSRQKEGTRIDVIGPLGNGFEFRPSSKNLLLIAGGIGFAPLLALADVTLADGRNVTLLQGHATASHLYPEELLPRKMKVVIATDDGSRGRKGFVTDLLLEHVPAADHVYACGPVGMYLTMAGKTALFGDRPVQVLLETVLGCGVGACLGCTIQTKHGQKQVCKDGPVFELRDVVWESMPCVGRKKMALETGQV